MADIVGYDPDKDYLSDPHQRDALTLRCDWCGHDIYSGETFSRVPSPLWVRNAVGKDEITFCLDCLHEIENEKAEFVGVRYGT